MNNKNWIAYVGPFNFPWGQAGSRRVYGNAKSFMELGYDVLVCTESEQNHIIAYEHNKIANTTLSYIGLASREQNNPLVLKALHYLLKWGKQTVKWLDQQQQKPQYVVVYGGYTAYAYHLQRWCKVNNIPIIIDLVEWYSPDQLGGRFSPFYLSANIAFHYLYPKFDGIIAISRFLENNFLNKAPVIVVPPTYSFDDNTNVDLMASIGKNLKLIYAGTPGTKDILDVVIQAILDLNQEGYQITLTLLGPSVQLVKQIANLETLPQEIIALGKVEQNEVKHYLQSADFSILIRPLLRFTNAGFPTKFVESLSACLPVIANISSDLDEYLFDGKNGFILKQPSYIEIKQTLQKAALLSEIEKKVMKENALISAQQYFCYKRFAPVFKEFFKQLVK